MDEEENGKNCVNAAADAKKQGEERVVDVMVSTHPSGC